VPVVIGEGGAERVLEAKLNEEEKRMLFTSFEHVKTLVDSIKL
jgi:malate/lactate dehydrogenase